MPLLSPTCLSTVLGTSRCSCQPGPSANSFFLPKSSGLASFVPHSPDAQNFYHALFHLQGGKEKLPVSVPLFPSFPACTSDGSCPSLRDQHTQLLSSPPLGSNRGESSSQTGKGGSSEARTQLRMSCLQFAKSFQD